MGKYLSYTLRYKEMNPSGGVVHLWSNTLKIWLEMCNKSAVLLHCTTAFYRPSPFVKHFPMAATEHS